MSGVCFAFKEIKEIHKFPKQNGVKMKLTFLSLLVTLSNFSYADSFTVVQNGKEYICEQTGSTNPGESAECARTAYNGPFSKDESIRLCQGARSTAPADCGISAYNGPFNKAESIQLCSGNGTVTNADCALKAYSGPYSKDESIRLCKANPILILRTLDLLHQSSDLIPKIEKIRSKIFEVK